LIHEHKTAPAYGRGFVFALALASVAFFASWALFTSEDGLAATSANPRSSPGRLSSLDGLPVHGIQKRLKEIGLYKGTVTGQLNKKTISAIRAYQKQVGLSVDGLASESLLFHLGSAVHQTRRLLGQLEDTRRKQSQAAQDALSSNPRVQALLRASEGKDGRRSGARKSRSCSSFPTPDCLISEALAATERIRKKELRNWALSGLVASQAYAGDVAAALKIAIRISDPRLIMTALGRISQAQVLAGRTGQARETAAAIPDPRLQAKAYLAIAKGQFKAGNPDLAKETLQASLTVVDQVSDGHQRALLLTEIANAEADAGNPQAAAKLLAKAEKIIANAKKSDNHERTLGQLAAARARIGQVKQALATAERITDEEWRITAYTQVVGYQAEAGYIAEALKLAGGITSKRFRAVALSRVAIAQSDSGDNTGARETLRRAHELSTGISLSYGNDYALSRISAAQAKTGQFKAAVKTAIRIKNGPLQVRTLWFVTLEQRLANDSGAGVTEAKTSAAMEALPNDLDKTWVMSEITLTQLKNGFSDKARKTFARALSSARALKSVWLRARALGKLAETLVALENHRQ
jgi:peptidoglycan hydrolase-like protein with peptidoglycan-binding domain